MKEKQRVLSRLPKIDVFLARPNVVALADSYSAALVKEALQAVQKWNSDWQEVSIPHTWNADDMQ